MPSPPGEGKERGNRAQAGASLDVSLPGRALAVLPEAGRAEAQYRGGEGAGGRQQQPSLYSILNKTRTAAGSRCLKR
jgi:hypothetical protein